jgi:hypothetical protein
MKKYQSNGRRFKDTVNSHDDSEITPRTTNKNYGGDGGGTGAASYTSKKNALDTDRSAADDSFRTLGPGG